MRKKIILLIAGQFFTITIKNKAVAVAGMLIVLVLVFAAFTGWKNYTVQHDMRMHYQRQVRQNWENNPDKHPHRMAHYGYLAFRPKYPLSFFDFGMESYTGNTVFLEAHKQNTVNFSEAGFSTGMLRFGEVSLAMILQILFPLLIFFSGFNAIAAERENGTLKIIISQGTDWKEILLGKSLGLAAVINCLYLPVVVLSVTMLMVINHFAVSSENLTGLFWVLLAYFIYFNTLSVIAVLISATSSGSKQSLLRLIGIWLLFIIVMPRALQAWGSYIYPSPSKIAFQTAIEKELIQQGDSHNPADPHYKAIKDSLLQTYKVETVQELPFNYSGFIMSEGEKISAGIYDQQLKHLLTTYQKQNDVSIYAAFVNPSIAVKNLSMAFTRTDFASYIDFQQQAENFRYRLAQQMNALQVKYISNKKPGASDKPYSISKTHWKEMPDFEYRFLNQQKVSRNEMLSILALIIWPTLLLLAIQLLSKRLKVL